MNVADDIELRRQLYGAGRRARSRAEARAELVAACRGLGERAAEWHANAYVPDTDLAAVDATISGIGRLLSELRAPEVSRSA